MSRILIAEDEDRLAAFIEKGLQKNGFSTAIAPDGEQAVLMAQNNEFDLILLDLGLPIKDGWTVLHELHAQGIKIPAIIVSARDDLTQKKVAWQDRVNDYIKKPFRFPDLLERIRFHLNQTSSLT